MPLLARYLEKPPALWRHQPSLKSKIDRVAGEFGRALLELESRNFKQCKRRHKRLRQVVMRKRCPTSCAFSRLLKAETRKKPSPFEPKPLPGVITTFNSFSIQSNVCQLVMPSRVSTQRYGALVPPWTVNPALFAASRKIRALPM